MDKKRKKARVQTKVGNCHTIFFLSLLEQAVSDVL